VPGVAGVGVSHSKAPSPHSSRECLPEPSGQEKQEKEPAPVLLQHQGRGDTSDVGTMGLLESHFWATLLRYQQSRCLPCILPWSLLQGRNITGGIQIFPYTQPQVYDGCFAVGGVGDTATGHSGGTGDSASPGTAGTLG